MKHMRVRLCGGVLMLGLARIGASFPAFAIEDGIRTQAQWAVRFIPTTDGGCSAWPSQRGGGGGLVSRFAVKSR